MAHRIGPTPQLSQPRSNSTDDVRGLALQMFKDSIDLRSRLIVAAPKDGTEDMEAPFPLQAVATGSLPSASLWEGAIIYDTTVNFVLYSNGTSWLRVDSNVLTDALLLDGSNTMENPLPLWSVNLASLPSAASWSGAIAFVGDEDLVYFSDGSSWRRVAGNPPEVLLSGSASGTTITFTDIPQDFGALHLQMTVSSDTATRHLQIQGSTDNGSTWMTTASDYVGFIVADTGTLSVINEASFIQTADVAAANSHIVGITFNGYANAGHVTAIGRLSNGTTNYSVQCTLAKFAAMNALRVIWNGSGNFDSGTYSLSGIF